VLAPALVTGAGLPRRSWEGAGIAHAPDDVGGGDVGVTSGAALVRTGGEVG
jgi:hypothetical protein